MMICEDVRFALAEGDYCEETDDGARVITHCVYPSFDPVHVTIVKIGDQYEVSDGGGASNSAWLHGHDGISKHLTKACSRFGVEARNGTAVLRVNSRDWLRSAIVAVANASAAAASSALDQSVASAETELADRIFDTLVSVVDRKNIGRDHNYLGVSGKLWRYNFILNIREKTFLINTITPHHSSVNSKYVAFSDSPANDHLLSKIAVHEKALDTSICALMTQVATLVPTQSLHQELRKLVS